MSAEEGFLPVEFISGSLYARTRPESKKVMCGCERRAYLVQVCSGIRGDAFEDLHVLDEALTGSFDLSLVGALRPGSVENGVDKTISPDRVKACRLGVHAGNLTPCDEAVETIVWY